MTDIIAQAVCDSYAENSPRLLTIFTRSPKFIHQESLRHRKIYIQDNLSLDPDFSLSVSSARAIPFPKLLEEVRDDDKRASPVFWGGEKKGMSPGGELSSELKAAAQQAWKGAALMAAGAAEVLYGIGTHKSIVNRIIEPYIHVNALFTATEPGWLNFFGLRLDKAADPTLRALAEACWKVWNENQPKKLNSGDWHLPYIDALDWGLGLNEQEVKERLIPASVARCARLSYLSFETQRRSTIEEDLKLYDRLVGSIPLHSSPAEHQATPDSYHVIHNALIQDHISGKDIAWDSPHLSGNLGPGWLQFRKMLKNEAIAPLPEGY